MSKHILKVKFLYSFIGSASAAAKIQDGDFIFTLNLGVNGKIGASATLTGGVAIGSTGKRTASISNSMQLPSFMIIEGGLSYNVDNGNLKGIIGGGVGVLTEIPMYSGDFLLGYEPIEIKISLQSNHSYPMTASEWERHLRGGKK